MEYIEPYKKIIFGDLIYIFLCLITFGFYYIFSRWFPYLYVLVSHKKSNFKNCNLLYIKSNQNDEIHCCQVKEIEIDSNNSNSNKKSIIRYFNFRKLNFIYSEENDEFKRIRFEEIKEIKIFFFF